MTRRPDRFIVFAAVVCLFILPSCFKTDDRTLARRSKDQSILARIATQSGNSATRGLAIDRLTDQTALGQVAMRERSTYFRLLAVEKLIDQEVMSEVAVRGSYDDARLAVIEKLTEQPALITVALDESPKEVRIAAIKRLTDQDTLSKLLKDPDLTDVDVLLPTVTNAVDQEILSAIVLGRGRWAAKDYHQGLMLAAVKNLSEEVTLAEIARGHGRRSKWADEYTAVLNIVASKVTDQEVLAEIALGTKPWSKRLEARSDAISRLDDQEVLLEISLEERSLFLRARATARLTDLPSLRKLLLAFADVASIQVDAARLSLFFYDPIIQKHLPGLEVQYSFEKLVEEYVRQTDLKRHKITGEKMSITVSQADAILWTWVLQTDYPERIYNQDTKYIWVDVDIPGIIAKVDSSISLTTEERSSLAEQSPVEEVRDYYAESLKK